MSNEINQRPDKRDELDIDSLIRSLRSEEPVPQPAQPERGQQAAPQTEEPVVDQKDWGNWKLDPIDWDATEREILKTEEKPEEPESSSQQPGSKQDFRTQLRQLHEQLKHLEGQEEPEAREEPEVPEETGTLAQPEQPKQEAPQTNHKPPLARTEPAKAKPQPEQSSADLPENPAPAETEGKKAPKPQTEPQREPASPQPASTQMPVSQRERRAFSAGEVITLNLHRAVGKPQPAAEPQEIFDQDEEEELESMLAKHAQEEQARENARKAAEQQAAAKRAAAAKETAQQIAQQVAEQAEAKKAAKRAEARKRAIQEAAALRAEADRIEAQWAKLEQPVDSSKQENVSRVQRTQIKPQPQPPREPVYSQPPADLDFLRTDTSKAQQAKLEQEALEEDVTLPKLAHVPELLRIPSTELEEPAGSEEPAALGTEAEPEKEQASAPVEEETPLQPLEEETRTEKQPEQPAAQRADFVVEEEDAELESMLSAHAGPVVQKLHPDQVTLEPDEEPVEEEPQEPEQTAQPDAAADQAPDEPTEEKPEEAEEAEPQEEEKPEQPVQPAPKKAKWFKKHFIRGKTQDEEPEDMDEEPEEDLEEDELADESLLEPPKRSPGLFRQIVGFVAGWIQDRPKGEAQDEEEDTHQEPDSNVVEMPQERPNLLRKKWEEMEERVNDFADSMFQAESAEAEEEEERYKRAERYIPGTDEEEERPRHQAKAKPKKAKKPIRRAPDTSPKELSRIYYSSWKSCKGRLPFQLVLALLLIALGTIASGEVPAIQIPALDQIPQLTGILLTVGLVGACLLGLDTLLEGIVELFRGRPSLNSLSSIGVFLTLVDSIWYATLTREGPLPFCGFAALSLWAVAWGNCRKKQGLYLSCQMAAAVSHPQRLTQDQGKWDNKGTFLKETGSAKGFGSQIQEPDGAQRVYHYAAPVMMIACFLFGILAAVGQQGAQQLVWDWSVIYVLSTPLTATLAYGVPYTKLVKRLNRSGVILAGWDGVDSMKGEAGIAITDRDLFPEGYVQFKGIKNFGQVSLEKMTGCTASMIREMDTGLTKIFDDQIRTQGGFYRRVDELKAAEGGFSGLIRGDQVLVGCADYMNLMGVPLKQGYQVRNAVFCVINGQLQGIFSLNYALAPNVKTSLDALIHGGVHPILATRDFNITPVMLRQRFHLPTERMQYPPVDRRHLLSAQGQPHNPVLGALIYREGLKAYTDAILGGRRLRTVVRLNTILALAASVVGALLGFYLAMMGAYYSLSPLNILFFMVMWLIPILLISNSVDKF